MINEGVKIVTREDEDEKMIEKKKENENFLFSLMDEAIEGMKGAKMNKKWEGGEREDERRKEGKESKYHLKRTFRFERKEEREEEEEALSFISLASFFELIHFHLSEASNKRRNRVRFYLFSI